MADNSKIEWTDSTFNPWIGCTKVSPGCDNCYAAAQDKFRGWTPEGWGGPRRRTGEDTWGKPTKWNDQPFFECPDCGLRGGAREMGDEPKTCHHLNARPARRRVFCASLADVFDNQVPAQWRVDLFRLIRETPNIDWLLLTKRIGNVSALMEPVRAALCPSDPMLLPLNVWLGATVVNQEEADRDIPKLLATPARVRFLSMEPLLGPVDLMPALTRGEPRLETPQLLRAYGGRPVLDWVIVGGESGHGARPMHPDWARSLRDQCAGAGVPFLFKQWGENVCAPIDPAAARDHISSLGVDGSRWALCKPQAEGWWALPPAAGTWREIDGLPHDVVEVRRIGKKAAGRLLDGRTHDGFPEVR